MPEREDDGIGVPVLQVFVEKPILPRLLAPVRLHGVHLGCSVDRRRRSAPLHPVEQHVTIVVASSVGACVELHIKERSDSRECDAGWLPKWLRCLARPAPAEGFTSEHMAYLGACHDAGMATRSLSKSNALIGIVLIVLGVAALAYQGITYRSRETVLEIGPIHATAERDRTLPIPPLLGFVAIAGGAALVIADARARTKP